jgi:hypothetical protein
MAVPPPHAREAVDRVARDHAAAALHALDRDRVGAEARDEAVAFDGRIGTTGEDRERGEGEALHVAGGGGG